MKAKPVFPGVAFAFVFLSFIGCASQGEVRHQQSPEFEIDKTRKQSVFLFRLSAEIDGKPIDMLREFNEHRIYISAANIDKESPLDRVSAIYTPLGKEEKENWFYLLLAPAAYYMEIRSIWHPKLAPILFYIPGESSFVYGGSLSFSCKGGLGTGFECSDIQVADETKAAETIADKFFNEHLPLLPILVDLYIDSLPESAKSELLPIKFSTSVDLKFEAPSWRKSVWSRTTGFGDWLDNPPSEPSFLTRELFLPYFPYIYIGGWVVYEMFIAPPVAAVLGEASQLYWNVCMQRHMDELSKTDLQKEILTAIQKEIPDVTAENLSETPLDHLESKEAKSLLELNILHVGLKECANKGTFRLEVFFCVKLWKTANKKLIYSKIFVFSDGFSGGRTIKPYFSFIYGSGCREMKSYCDDETWPVFKAEISNSIEAVVQAIRKDIGLPLQQEDPLPEELDNKDNLTP